jgi:SOS response regulatory protein OraA/RecX
MRAHLTKKTQQFPEALPFIDEVISFLLEEKYLNDKEFIKEYVRSRTTSKPRSGYLMTRELNMKGVSPEDIEQYFQKSPLDEDELAKRALAKVCGRWKNIHPFKRKKKAYDYLARKGFSYDIIRSIYEQEPSI